MTFTAGTALIMWLGEHITQNGIGNGISIILFAGIVSRGPSLVRTACYNLVKQRRPGSIPVRVVLMIVIGSGRGRVHRVHVQCRAPHPGAVRQARGGPQDVRRPVHPPADQGQRVRRYADHLRVVHPVAAPAPCSMFCAAGGRHGRLACIEPVLAVQPVLYYVYTHC